MEEAAITGIPDGARWGPGDSWHRRAHRVGLVLGRRGALTYLEQGKPCINGAPRVVGSGRPNVFGKWWDEATNNPNLEAEGQDVKGMFK